MEVSRLAHNHSHRSSTTGHLKEFATTSREFDTPIANCLIALVVQACSVCFFVWALDQGAFEEIGEIGILAVLGCALSACVLAVTVYKCIKNEQFQTRASAMSVEVTSLNSGDKILRVNRDDIIRVCREAGRWYHGDTRADRPIVFECHHGKKINLDVQFVRAHEQDELMSILQASGWPTDGSKETEVGRSQTMPPTSRDGVKPIGRDSDPCDDRKVVEKKLKNGQGTN